MNNSSKQGVIRGSVLYPLQGAILCIYYVYSHLILDNTMKAGIVS